MSRSETLVDRTIPTLEFDRLNRLTTKFNENHKISRLYIKRLDENLIELKYKYPRGTKIQPFGSFREAERWIRYMNYADIN